MEAKVIREALDAVLREADRVPRSRGGAHTWNGLPWSCTAHDEGHSCCLDPHHDEYAAMLDYLAERLAQRLAKDG